MFGPAKEQTFLFSDKAADQGVPYQKEFYPLLPLSQWYGRSRVQERKGEDVLPLHSKDRDHFPYSRQTIREIGDAGCRFHTDVFLQDGYRYHRDFGGLKKGSVHLGLK